MRSRQTTQEQFLSLKQLIFIEYLEVLWVSSLCRGHANLHVIPILVYVLPEQALEGALEVKVL